ncbi:hypothetical protein ACF1BQ_022290 [Bradyrhizobium sp. RDT10]
MRNCVMVALAAITLTNVITSSEAATRLRDHRHSSGDVQVNAVNRPGKATTDKKTNLRDALGRPDWNNAKGLRQ